MKKLKFLFISAFLTLTVFSFAQIALAATTPATGGTYDFQNQSGLNKTGDKAGYAVNDDSNTVDSILGTVLRVGLSLVGILFFAYLIYGAYMLMTSRGNDQKVQTSTDTITNAIIGLIITLSAYVISNFLINYFWQPK